MEDMRKRRSRVYIELIRVQCWPILTWIAVRKVKIYSKSDVVRQLKKSHAEK